MSYLLIGFLAIILLGSALIYFFTRKKKRKVSRERFQFFLGQIRKIDSHQTQPKEQIMELDKLLHHILQEFGYTGSLGDILKNKPSEIRNLDAIWDYHKLRNKLAHDFDTIDAGVIHKKAKGFLAEVKHLLQQMD